MELGAVAPEFLPVAADLGEVLAQLGVLARDGRVVVRSPRGTQSLYFYYGCDMQRNRALAERLSAAPALLPIGDFIRAAR